jgi:predicted PurR-regulated permease PerM
MNTPSQPSENKQFQARTLEAAIHIGLVALLLLWTYNIVKPFILPVLWGAIIAVAIYPVFWKFQKLLGGREKLAAVLLTLFALALLITPTAMLSDSVINNTKFLSANLQEGTLSIPPPSRHVKDWPLVGETVHSTWSLASTNLGALLEKFKPQLKTAGAWLLSSAAGVGGTLLQFFVSIVIAGVLLIYARSSSRTVELIAARLMGQQSGKEVAELAEATIRSVAQGVLGVALIQAILAAIGLILVGVPYAGLWALLVLLLAIVQLPPLLILGPVIAYVFATSATVPAVIFMIWSLLVSMSDSFLKPLLLGRGMDIPMLVILLGAIGGMLLSGIIGLFVGAVVLAVAYTLFTAWLEQAENADTEAPVSKQ